MSRRVSIPLACCALMLVVHVASAAQIFENLANPELVHDPSVRAFAMGGASRAVFWGIGPDHWANPALLGFVDGIHYEDVLERFPTITFGDGTSNLDIRLRNTARAVTIGYGGVGLALADPLGGGVHFHGDLGGTAFDEQVHSWSAAISVSRIIGTVGGLLDRRAPGFARYVDGALGFRRKRLKTDFGSGRSIEDWGLLAKVGVPFELHRVACAIEASYGHSELGMDASQSDRSSSVAVHAMAGSLSHEAPGRPGWFRAGLEPLISIGGALDVDRAGTSQHAWGAEVALANLLFLRTGRNAGDVATHGYGVALPLGRFGGMRYESASSNAVFDARYRSWSAWIDPIAIARAGR